MNEKTILLKFNSVCISRNDCQRYNHLFECEKKAKHETVYDNLFIPINFKVGVIFIEITSKYLR